MTRLTVTTTPTPFMNTEENKTKGPARFVMNCRFFFDFAGVMGSLLFELKNGQSDCDEVGSQPQPDNCGIIGWFQAC